MSKFVFDLPEGNAGKAKVEPGQYALRFKAVENVPADLERGYKQGLKFMFETDDGRPVGRICSVSFGPKAGLPKFYQCITGVEFKGGKVDFAPYIGRRYAGQVVRTEAGGVRVETVMQLPG